MEDPVDCNCPFDSNECWHYLPFATTIKFFLFGLLSDTPSGKRYAYPDLDFLENDVGLWDTFFSHGKNR